MTSILAVTNNHDGTYTVQFSDPIVNLNPGIDTPDPNILFLTPGNGGSFVAIANAPESTDTIVLTATSGNNTATGLVILDQPVIISSGSAFEVAAPQITAT